MRPHPELTGLICHQGSLLVGYRGLSLKSNSVDHMEGKCLNLIHQAQKSGFLPFFTLPFSQTGAREWDLCQALCRTLGVSWLLKFRDIQRNISREAGLAHAGLGNWSHYWDNLKNSFIIGTTKPSQAILVPLFLLKMDSYPRGKQFVYVCVGGG